MDYIYATHGTCSTMIELSINDGLITKVKFHKGCNGNLQGLSSLVVGMKPEDVINRLKGIRCGAKPTSCPDQLAAALSCAISNAAD